MKHPTFPAFDSIGGPAAPPVESGNPRWILHSVLLLLTVLTTLYCGYDYHVRFTARSPQAAEHAWSLLASRPWLLLYGAPFSLTLLAILLAHEMGHYWSCRHHGVDATLPFVIPAPPLIPLPPPIGWLLGRLFGFSMGPGAWVHLPFNPFGTFGAVIRIKSLFYNRRQLFDVGIAGPLAGFAFIVPALIAGIWLSGEFVSINQGGTLFVFGEPLAFQWATRFFFRGSEGSGILLHPVGWAAWFGLLATSINLLPIGQLDGGHVVYALFGPKVHRVVSIMAFTGLIALNIFSWPALGYAVFAAILAAMGFRHPPTYDDFTPIDRPRIWLAVFGLIVFVLTFIPFPIRILEKG